MAGPKKKLLDIYSSIHPYIHHAFAKNRKLTGYLSVLLASVGTVNSTKPSKSMVLN
jgi:hypothetical protein